MRFERPLLRARLIRRHKRFLADVEMAEGARMTVHCPNTGAMLGCQAPRSRIWLSESDKPSRKYRHTWEIVETREGTKVGINTMRSNALVDEALEEGLLEELRGYLARRREVRVADGRLDFLLTGHPRDADCFVEVKNVTAAVDGGVAVFPDAVSIRATRHLESLTERVAEGFRAALVFCVQRNDVDKVLPADSIDPAYGKALRRAHAGGVEIYAVKAKVSPQQIALQERVAVELRALQGSEPLCFNH